MTSIYLVSLCLQGIMKCPGLIELLVQPIHLLMMLFLQTLSLLLKLGQILEEKEIGANIFKQSVLCD